MNAPTVGRSVTVAVRSRRTDEVVAYSGTVTADRYPHLYVGLDIGATVLRLPLDRIVKVVNQ